MIFRGGKNTIDFGRINKSFNSSGSGSSVWISFTKTFSTIPVVICNLEGNGQYNAGSTPDKIVSTRIYGVTQTGFYVQIMNFSGTTGGQRYIHWIAIGT